MPAQPDPDFFDLTAWPMAFIRFPELHEPERVARLLAGLDGLLARQQPFVAIWSLPSHDHDDEPHADEKAAILWIKKHKVPLNQLCQGYVYITDDSALQTLLKERLQTVSKTLYRFPMRVVANRQMAIEVAGSMLAGR
ncbi:MULTISPECIES: hypothetical protein [unclassified Pseudomonas]|jgi:hypothetical protein|uniref:hypothetical protein n=1 Tax=unclassified Pseudomonas TaxID=196821 RepID=UPI00244D41A5|nr:MULTISPECIES: hypothetical protein [unclassified Pseudomonas]MDH0892865.1 hypothetical protein [Pseudomonas sp. GD03875]MDH1064661.1 hypothetical protein [Pseudomonas sp. GD03985]